jgi:hypothetical protein
MILPDRYSGKIAAVVAQLEMTTRPPLRGDPAGARTLRRVSSPASTDFAPSMRGRTKTGCGPTRARLHLHEVAAEHALFVVGVELADDVLTASESRSDDPAALAALAMRREARAMKGRVHMREPPGARRRAMIQACCNRRNAPFPRFSLSAGRIGDELVGPAGSTRKSANHVPDRPV